MTEVACPGCGAPLIRDGRRLERSWVCSAPQRNQVYADCVNLSALLRCARDTLCQLMRANESRSARMGTSGRTAGSTRGWMGALAPITTVCPAGETCGG